MTRSQRRKLEIIQALEAELETERTKHPENPQKAAEIQLEELKLDLAEHMARYERDKSVRRSGRDIILRERVRGLMKEWGSW